MKNRQNSDIVTAAELAESDLTPNDVWTRCPWAVTYHDDDGQPYWLRRELAGLVEDADEGEDE